MVSPEPAILRIERLRLSYRTRRGSVRAVDEATLEVHRGEAVGLVGESGSGKSTIARAALGLLPSGLARIEGGRILIEGQDVTGSTEQAWESRRGHPIAIVFQDPLSFLNPVMRIGRQIAESVERHDPEAHAGDRVRELLDLVKLPPACAKAHPHELSGGMRQRALLAVALGCRPRLLVADEPTTALDVTTQAEILALLSDLRQRLDMALLLISHDLAVVASACEDVVIMYAGRTVEAGRREAVFSRPAHPYTLGLLRAAVSARDAGLRFATIEGDMPDPGIRMPGCPFAPRCSMASERCAVDMPDWSVATRQANHVVRCWEWER